MPIVDLSGTRAVRYPDPTVPRVSPNGVQPYSAYTAFLVWRNPVSAVYQTDLLYHSPPSDDAQMLLFGTDYPAIVSSFASFPTTTYSPAPPVELAIKGLTFTEQFYGTDNLDLISPSLAAANYPPTYQTGIRYKEIVTAATTTNSVTVNGFPVVGPLKGYDLYDSSGVATASMYVQIEAVMNGAVISSSSSFYETKVGPRLAGMTNLPVILWEPNLTQQIVDDGFQIEAFVDLPNPLQVGALSKLDVVGIWAARGYSPILP
jgi:hypothetical protein